MTRTVAMLLALTLAACGSASSAGPKTSNPPLKPAPKPEPSPDPSGKDLVEQDGMTLKFKLLGFKLTMTPSPWKGNVAQQDDGSLLITFKRDDLGAMVVIFPLSAKGASAKAIAEKEHASVSNEPNLTLTPVVDDGKGRWAFTGDRAVDGKDYRTYLTVAPHPSVADGYLLVVAHSSKDASDAFLKEVRTILDSLAPL